MKESNKDFAFKAILICLLACIFVVVVRLNEKQEIGRYQNYDGIVFDTKRGHYYYQNEKGVLKLVGVPK